MRISRREVMSGALALAGVSAWGGAALADSFKLAADERLFVGMVGMPPDFGFLQSWRHLIGDNPRDQLLIAPPTGGLTVEDRLEYGARVWVAVQRGDKLRTHHRTRVLRVAAADSPVAKAVRESSMAAAERTSVWMDGRVGQEKDGDVFVWLNHDERLSIRESKALSSRSNPLLRTFAGMGGSNKPVAVRVGRIWSGTWQVFETKVLG